MPSKKKAAKDAVPTSPAAPPAAAASPAAAPAPKAKKPAKAAPAPATPAAPAAPQRPAKAAAPKAAPAKPEASTPKPAPKAPGKAKPEAPPRVAAKPAAPKPAAPKPAAAKAKPAKGSKAKAEQAPEKAAPPQAPKPARGKAAPAAAEEPAEDDELDADLAAAGELEELDIDLEGDEDEDDDEDGEAVAPAAPAKGKGAPKAPPAKGAAGKAPAAPAGRGTGKGEAPDAGGGGLAGLLRALGAARATPPKRPAGGMDLGDGDEGGTGAARGAATADEEAPAAPPPPKVQRTVPPMPPRKPGVITMAISPDADDAYMMFALEHGLVATEDRKYEVVRGEVSRLNEEALRGTYDVTAFSFGSWPQLVDRYLVLPSGASLGDGVGPVVVSKTPVRSSEVSGLQVGVPGLTTTGALVLRMWLHPARLNLVALPFEAVPLAVATGQVRAGVLIHEAQLTYRAQGLVLVKDLGAWWTERTEGLPLPLGGMLVRRDISPEERTKINLDIKRSIAYAMGHRADALAHAARFAKGLTTQQLERYIENYVNELSLDMGERGRQAVHTLFQEARRQGLVREVVELEMA